MKEQADIRVIDVLPDHLRSQQKMIILYPNDVSWLIDLFDDVDIVLVDLNVVVPVFFFDSAIGDRVPEDVMKQRPED